jgi:signal transduction histidine kinase
MIQVTDSTETALFRQKAMAMNEALVLSSVRQHELVEAAESLNAQIRESHDLLERRVTERTAELAAANVSLKAEIGIRESAEASRRELLQRLTTAQEDERRRIARDLHDQMGQHLTALGLGLKVVKDEHPEPSGSRDRLEKLQALTDLIGREVHQLALELRPTSLDDLGLHTALTHYNERWSAQSGVTIDFQSVGPDIGRLPEAVETVLYRVIQEALTNVLRHAKARWVSLVLQRFANQAVAVVEDDGVGFDTESMMASVGDRGRLGLLGMRERVALIDGTLTVESTPGRGTTIIARVPLPDGRRERGDV